MSYQFLGALLGLHLNLHLPPRPRQRVLLHFNDSRARLALRELKVGVHRWNLGPRSPGFFMLASLVRPGAQAYASN